MRASEYRGFAYYSFFNAPTSASEWRGPPQDSTPNYQLRTYGVRCLGLKTHRSTYPPTRLRQGRSTHTSSGSGPDLYGTHACTSIGSSACLGGQVVPTIGTCRNTQTLPHPSARAHLTPPPQCHIFNSGPLPQAYTIVQCIVLASLDGPVYHYRGRHFW